ncbi:HD-GYP domain-containing protein [Streptomyces sp. SID13031]|uniref:HD-GYP domain-containing protein n=1 Tax=Streptomyces sp. SID13031 TaxID=2706046 RepID=UPI0013C99D52|nr:HD-GYP domain-containing protein [Streptomyces sp. SID13031]NEA33824.1 HD-GYP domain-containing protein [Streptomyces sp. SID13031]
MRRHALRAFVSVATILALLVLGLAFWHVESFWTLLALCFLMLVGGLLRFSVGPTYLASLDSVVLMTVYVIAGPWAAVIAAAVAYLPQVRRRMPLIRRIFNGTQRIFAAAAGGVAYTLAAGPVGDSALDHEARAILATMAATVAQYVANAALVCLVIWIEGKASPLAFLRQVVIPTFLPMAGYGFLGLLLAVVWLGGLGPVAGLLVLGPLLVARWALSQYEVEKTAQAATMRAFIQVIETKDLYTRGHSERVSEGVGMLGRFLRLSEDRQSALEHAGLLHDVGKVGVPTSIIQKPGRLDDSEMDAIRLHPARGVELIGNIPFLEEVKSAVLHHHEKYDGTGYPAGLSGTNIPYFARIIGIVDAFDCLTSTRSYRPARSVPETLAILEQDRYSHFDPQLVDAFVKVIATEGWKAAEAEQLPPDASVQASIDHDDLSLGSSGGASGSAAGPS